MINPVTRIFRYFRRIYHSEPDFKLITKTGRVDISQMDESKHWQTPSNAVAFDYVEIGKASDKKFSREVMTFFDNSGRMISKIFRHNGKNVKLRFYQYFGDVKFITNMIFDASGVEKNVENDIYNFDGVWKKNFDLKQRLIRYLQYERNGEFPAGLITKRVDYTPKKGEIDKITVTHYPINLEYRGGKTRYITGIFENNEGFPFLKKYITNATFDSNDKYFKYRFFNLYTPKGIIAVTKGILKEEGLGPLNIKVVPNSTEVKKSNIAHFNPNSGEIHYSKELFDKQFLDIFGYIIHEIEHAKQWALIGRLGKEDTPYCSMALKKLGEITDPEELKTANACHEAALKYLNSDQNPNINYFNYLEYEARKAAQKAIFRFQDYKNSSFFNTIVNPNHPPKY